MSDMSGLLPQRLELSLKLAFRKEVMNTTSLIFSMDNLDGNSAMLDLLDLIAKVVSEEVIKEIKAHSVLVGAVRDTGPAGAGIIAGSLG